MNIGRTCPRLQELGFLYNKSPKLQKFICEYLITVVLLCKESVLFLKKSPLAQLSSSILNLSKLGTFQSNLESPAVAIRDEVAFLSSQLQIEEAKESSTFRTLAAKFSETASLELQKTTKRRRLKAKMRSLNACSMYDFQMGWKVARRKGTSNWICERDEYKQWSEHRQSSIL